MLLHSTVSSAGIVWSHVGSVVSCTVISCVCVAVLPQMSVAVHVRVKV